VDPRRAHARAPTEAEDEPEPGHGRES
jgi:hypothetical protein